MKKMHRNENGGLIYGFVSDGCINRKINEHRCSLVCFASGIGGVETSFDRPNRGLFEKAFGNRSSRGSEQAPEV